MIQNDLMADTSSAINGLEFVQSTTHNSASGMALSAVDVTESDTRKPERQLSQAQQLLGYAEAADLFRTSSGDTYATILVDSHYETWSIDSQHFREWMMCRYYAGTQNAPTGTTLNEAINLSKAKALFAGKQVDVFTRFAEHNEKIYLDLGDPDWTVIEIDAIGWRLASHAPVRFHRPPGMDQLPVPSAGGSIEDLRRFLNVGSESDWKLMIGWLIGALRPRGPYPILVLHGEQGSAKSTAARMLRSLVDPNNADLRSEPRDIRDVMIAAKNSWVISLDNLSRLQNWLSDCLCRLSTGGGFSTRQLYSNTDEVLIEVQRPSILNGISDLATRADLLDRSLILYLPPISENSRRTERELWRDFNAARAGILGGLLTAVSCALAHVDEVNLPALPRLADFAAWVTAAEPSLGWTDGAFMAAYNGNRETANELALEASPVVHAMQQVCSQGWRGTAGDLLVRLSGVVDEATLSQRSWPRSGRSLRSVLNRIAPNLRKIGISIEFDVRESNRARDRLIVISPSAEVASTPTASLIESNSLGAQVQDIVP
jgi:hypothetical protein